MVCTSGIQAVQMAAKQSTGMRVGASVLLALLYHCAHGGLSAYCPSLYIPGQRLNAMMMLLSHIPPAILQIFMQLFVLACNALLIFAFQPIMQVRSHPLYALCLRHVQAFVTQSKHHGQGATMLIIF